MSDPKRLLKRIIGAGALVEGFLGLFLLLSFVMKFSNPPETVAAFRAVIIAFMAWMALRFARPIRDALRLITLDKRGQRRVAELAEVVPTEGREAKRHPCSAVFRFDDGSELRIPVDGTVPPEQIGKRKLFLLDPEDPTNYRIMPCDVDAAEDEAVETEAPGDEN